MPVTEEKREAWRQEIETLVHPAKVVTGGAVGGGICGGAAAVVSIVGLAGLLPAPLASVAVILVGAAMAWEGSLVATQYGRIAREASYLGRVELGSETGAQALGGGAGTVLGILALLAVHPLILDAIAVIVYGGVLIMSAYPVELNFQRKDGTFIPFQVGNKGGAAGLQAVAGSACAILGILALVGAAGLAALTMTLVATLCAGGTLLWSGAAVSRRMVKGFIGGEPM